MFNEKWIFLVFISLFSVIIPIHCSGGDRSPFFINCVRGCASNNCTSDGLDFQRTTKERPPQEYMNHLLLWSCIDECNYHCMWRTTLAFVDRKWDVPQFFGKWPFIRFLGIQEPASVAFSLMNFWAHWRMIKQFRREVRSDSPMFYVWHVFCGICLNGWIWSVVFHTRDYPLTELLDYTFAYSIVLASCCCMILRMLHNHSRTLKIIVTAASMFYFLNHFAHLSVGNFDYAYNMQANVVTGLIGGIGWISWYALQRKAYEYAWKILAFQGLAAASLCLELTDFPPLWWTFDAHALWHLATVPLTLLFYSFIIQDCRKLRENRFTPDVEKEKLI